MFVALAMTWGSSFLFIKVGLEALTAAQVVSARLVLGAGALLALTAVTRTPLPKDLRLWGHLLVVALVALPQERLTRERTVGLALGFAGVLSVLGVWQGPAAGTLAGETACLAATASYGVACVYLRKFVAGRGLPALTVATAQVSRARPCCSPRRPGRPGRLRP